MAGWNLQDVYLLCILCKENQNPGKLKKRFETTCPICLILYYIHSKHCIEEKRQNWGGLVLVHPPPEAATRAQHPTIILTIILTELLLLLNLWLGQVPIFRWCCNCGIFSNFQQCCKKDTTQTKKTLNMNFYVNANAVQRTQRSWVFQIVGSGYRCELRAFLKVTSVNVYN